MTCTNIDPWLTPLRILRCELRVDPILLVEDGL